jgi:hypothetical protein
MKRRELAGPVDPRDRAGSGRCRQIVEGEAVLATLRSVGGTMWRDPDPNKGGKPYRKCGSLDQDAERMSDPSGPRHPANGETLCPPSIRRSRRPAISCP